ncbi:MAG: hypothetical protein MHPSP_004451, partial [Paramarteilia canceri]
IKDTPDYVLLVSFVILLNKLVSIFTGIAIQHSTFIYALTFIYSQMYAGKKMSIMGLFNFDSSLMAYVYAVLDILLFGV